jgi:hypothetical protein
MEDGKADDWRRKVGIALTIGAEGDFEWSNYLASIVSETRSLTFEVRAVEDTTP